MINENQMPKRFIDIINDQVEIYNEGTSITVFNTIPDTSDIPIENPKHWLRIPDVICVYVDMINSTQFSAEKNDKTTAGVYQLFTNTAVKIFHEFDAPYIDVRGDGVFALFNSNQFYTSIASAITFKTFSQKVFTKIIEEKTDIEIGCHIGIDQKTLLVRKIGLKRKNGRTDRQNEVWAGKPVNMASKLASLSKSGELIVSDRYFNKIKSDLVLKSCGCPNDKKEDLWESIDLTNDSRFDFDRGYVLKSIWCEKHGKEYCEEIIKLDED
jgi:class 3 adenylate cyclase